MADILLRIEKTTKPVAARFPRLLRFGVSILCCIAIVGIAAASRPFVEKWLKAASPNAVTSAEREKSATPLADDPNGLCLADDVVRRLGVKAEPVQDAVPPEPLKLLGSLYLDPSKLARVRSRFAGEVVELGVVEGMPDDPVRQPYLVKREVRAGDPVKKNQVLAVIWSKDLGEKKSELVTALSNMWIHEENAQRLEALYRDGGTTERTVREAQQLVEQDRITVQRVKRTLASWRLTDAEIQGVVNEARLTREEARVKLPAGQPPNAPDRKANWKDWAKVEVRAPDFDGIVLEMNFAINDVINDNTVDLFKIGDLSKLRVAANAFEEDLPALERLQPQRRQWKIRMATMPEGQFLLGAFDQIGQIIDPMQKTALVKGWVDNSDRMLHVGQTVTATVELPPPDKVVTVPVAALVEDGQTCRVFVQPDQKRPCYICRQVTLAGRVGNMAYLRAGVVKPGDLVVVAGAVELAAALEDLQTKNTMGTP